MPPSSQDQPLAPIHTSRSLPILLLRTREAVMRHFRPMLAAHGLTEQQWRVLRVLDEQATLDVTQVAELSCLLRPSLTRISRALQEEGLIEAFHDPKDRRRTLLRISDKGRALVLELTPRSQAIYAELDGMIGEGKVSETVEMLESLLKKLV